MARRRVVLTRSDVDSGTPLQVVNESDEELLLYIYGAPPERGHAEFMDSAV